MSSYISSDRNRFYVASESNYGQCAPVASTNRFPGAHLQAHQNLQVLRRQDKTGTRTYLGSSASSRRQTAFDCKVYLTSWTGNAEPSYGPLFSSALGAQVSLSSGLAVASVQGTTQIQTTTAHGLAIGSGVSYGNELRFVTNVVDTRTIFLNAPFKGVPQPGATLAPTATYCLADALPSVSIYDYWDPITAVSRLVTGAGVDILTLSVNGDYHEFTFTGPAADLLDTSSFASGMAGLNSFPAEPQVTTFDQSVVPGHLGEVWLGLPANQCLTLTSASFEVKNNIELRNEEFGSSYPRAIVPGAREVVSKFSILAQDDAQTIALYTAAKQRVQLPFMLQLGQQQGQLMGIFMPQVIPEIPMYDDSQPRLQWQFVNNLAQGVNNDEIFIAFG